MSIIDDVVFNTDYDVVEQRLMSSHVEELKFVERTKATKDRMEEDAELYEWYFSQTNYYIRPYNELAFLLFYEKGKRPKRIDPEDGHFWKSALEAIRAAREREKL